MDRDYNIVLNDCLQRTTEGNIAHELIWEVVQKGPNHNVVHCATARLRGVTIGEGQGKTIGLAKREASKHAYTYLKINGLPGHQD